MPAPQLFHIDAFTRTAFCGNPAGVVLNADSLSAQQMQSLARELKHSETAFVCAAQADDHDVLIRYFTPTTEVPICGHATIAAHYARALWLGLGSGLCRQKTAAGIQQIRIEAQANDWTIVMQQGPIRFGPPLNLEQRQRLASALGLQHSDLIEELPVQAVSTGHAKWMIPLRPGVSLEQLKPDLAALTAISRETGCNGYYPFLLDSARAQTEGRMFAPAIGITEDPVTGNANGPLGAYLVRYQLLPHDGRQLVFTGRQGRTLGREGSMQVTVEIEQQAPQRVSIRGEAVLLFTAALACCR